MNKRNSYLFVKDIANEIDNIASFVQKHGKKEFMATRMLQYAVTKSLENIGEAAKNIDDETKNLVPNLPWKNICRTRDYYVHHYFSIDKELVWKIVEDDIPLLREGIIKIQKELEILDLLNSDVYDRHDKDSEEKKSEKKNSSGLSI